MRGAREGPRGARRRHISAGRHTLEAAPRGMLEGPKERRFGMGVQRLAQSLLRRPNWCRAAPLTVVLVALGSAGIWWLGQAQNAVGETPRLAVDRTEMDLGRFPFEAPARAVFVLRNEGSAPLQIVEVSPVRALKGC